MTADRHEPGPLAELERLMRGYQFTQALRVAVELSIPDRLATGPRSATELADDCGAHAASLERLLRALTALGVFTEPESGVFGPTSWSDALCIDGSRRAWLLMNAIDLYETWAQLGHSVRTGETATSLVYGMDSWSWRAQHPEQGARFDAAMTDLSRRRVEDFVRSYDMSRFDTVVDVGGGRGTLLAGVLGVTPGSRGVLFDQAHVVAAAPAVLEAAGVADRVVVSAGDFFRDVPVGGNAYLLSAVLHDWSDKDAKRILERCHAAMRPGSTLVLYERALPPATATNWDPHFSDLNMLQGPGGRERAAREWRALVEGAGFTVQRVIIVSAETAMSIIESTRN